MGQRSWNQFVAGGLGQHPLFIMCVRLNLIDNNSLRSGFYGIIFKHIKKKEGLCSPSAFFLYAQNSCKPSCCSPALHYHFTREKANNSIATYLRLRFRFLAKKQMQMWCYMSLASCSSCNNLCFSASNSSSVSF